MNKPRYLTPLFAGSLLPRAADSGATPSASAPSPRQRSEAGAGGLVIPELSVLRPPLHLQYWRSLLGSALWIWPDGGRDCAGGVVSRYKSHFREEETEARRD